MENTIPADAAAEGTAADLPVDPAIAVEAPVAEPAAAEEPSIADQPAEEPAAPEFTSVHDYLMKGLMEDEAPAASEPAAEDPPVEKTADADPEKAPETVDPAKPDPEKPASEEKPEPIKLLSREEIDQKFNRAPKEIRDVADQYGRHAEALQAQLDAYGGEHFAEPMKLIAEGLQGDDNIPIIAGVMKAQGVDGFVGLMADIVKVGLVDTLEATPANEGEQYFQDQCKVIADTFFKTKFGEGASMELAAKLLKYEAEGLLNTSDVDEYYGQNGQGAAAPSPLLQEKEAKIAELEAKLAEAEATGTDAKKGDETRHADTWEKQTNDAGQKVLDDLFYKRSVLREVATDLPEIKEAKAQVRLLLNDHIRSYQKADPRFSELKQSAYKGNTNTAKYQKAYTAFIDDTLFEAKKLAGPLEKAFALIYQLGQNGKVIVDPTKDPSASAGADSSGQGSPKTPTQTNQPEKKDMSIEEWRLHMAREIAAGN